MSFRHLFLDCDGVIAYSRAGEAITRLRLDCLARLAHLVQRTGARVVVSSTWRATYTRGSFEALFRQAGHPIPIAGVTPVHAAILGGVVHESVVRGEEIAAWIAAHRGEVGAVAILDDWPAWCFGALASRLVQTDHEAGLTDADVARVEALFAEAPAHALVGAG